MSPAGAHRNLRLLYLFWFLRDFHLWIPVWVVFLTIERGFSLTQVTAADGLYLVGVLLLEVPTGAVADRWGRSRSLALGSLVLGASVLIFAFTNSFSVLLTSFLLWSVSSTLMSGADMALLYDTLKASDETAAYELHAGRGMACSWLGAGAGTLLGGPVAALLDLRATIFIGAATCLVTMVVALLLREPPHVRATEGIRYFSAIRGAAAEVWQSTDVRSVVIFAGATMAVLEGVHYLTQPYLVDRGLEVGIVFSMLQVPMILAGAGGAFLAGQMGGGQRLRAAFIAIPLLGTAAYVALGTAPGLTAYVAFPVLMALASSLMPLASGYVNRRVGSDYRATVLSIQNMVLSVVLAGLAPVLGYTTDRWGLPWAFAVGAFMAAAALILVRPRPRLTAPEPAPRSLAAEV